MSESLLTVERPHLWRAAVGLAEGLTGYTFPPKRPAADGTIYACGEGPPRPPEPPPTPAEEKRRIREEIRNEEDNIRRREGEGDGEDELNGWNRTLGEMRELLEELRKDLEKINAAPSVEVPDGAMEWLLHEAGHWVAATPAERLLPNYGVGPSETGSDGDRELQAWAFEEIVLAPFGHARDFAPPSQRDGAAFAKAGPLPEHAMRHVERQVTELGLDVAQWRAVWGDWVRWGIGKGLRAPWISVN